MSNIYHEHLERLRKIEFSGAPAISLYVPLKWTDMVPGKVYSALLKAANGLLQNEGHPKMEMCPPEWGSWMQQGTITLAIFHTQGTTIYIPLPLRMQPRVVVASSFHIKPILTAANEYVEALLLHFNEAGASLYRVNPVTERLIESYLPSQVLPRNDWPARLDRASLREFLDFLSQEIKGNKRLSTKLLVVTGSSYAELRNEGYWSRLRLPVVFLDDSFKVALPQNAFAMVRIRLAQIVKEAHTRSVLEAMSASDIEQDGISVREVGAKILQNEVRRLCVSLDDMHFGELDPGSGYVVLNKNQTNTKDDDVLDDLVEMALEKGVNVSVVPKKYLPVGKTFIAS
jgi:hypothetical protein